MKSSHHWIVESVQSNAPRIAALVALAVFALAALAGCKSSNYTTAKVDPTGVYTLVSVDGKPVPCEVMHGKTPMAIKGGTFTINADGSCSSFMTFAVPPHKDINREVKATYTQRGADLNMKWEGAGMTKGKVNGDRFTMNNEGMSFTYEK